jgi:putative acetyltransferase
MSSVIVRPEKPEDIPAVSRVNGAAFGRPVEGELVIALRDRGALIVSLVAVRDDEIVGHIAFSPMTTDPASPDTSLIALGPIAVVPEHQNRGIGGSLVHAGMETCLELGYEAVFLVGHAEYYPRFGFTKASDWGIVCEFEAPEDAWMAAELKPGTLNGLRGITVLFHPAFREFVE